MAKVESCAHRFYCADLVRAISSWRAEYNDAAAERDKLARRVKRLERLIVAWGDEQTGMDGRHIPYNGDALKALYALARKLHQAKMLAYAKKCDAAAARLARKPGRK